MAADSLQIVRLAFVLASCCLPGVHAPSIQHLSSFFSLSFFLRPQLHHSRRFPNTYVQYTHPRPSFPCFPPQLPQPSPSPTQTLRRSLPDCQRTPRIRASPLYPHPRSWIGFCGYHVPIGVPG
ncbi:hypothetical protein IWZ01DRAFT_335696 [Phyllosticta capitalensis]